MKINTKYFGEMNISDEEKIGFPEPLPGFEESREYVIIRFYDDDDSLLCMQSLQDPDLAFILMNPFYLLDDYVPTFSPEDLNILQADESTPLAFYAITVVHENWHDSTVNLRCPVAVNPAARKGRQLIMSDTSYSMRHPLDAPQETEG